MTVSQFYTDAFSQKSREIDLIAEKAFSSTAFTDQNATVIVRLFVECKYINSTTVLWLDKKNLEKAKDVVRATDAFHDPDTNYLVTEKHHYLANLKVAKLFSSEGGKDRENDPIYKAITQCLNALIYFRHHETKLHKKYDHRDVIEINYPLVVCNSFKEFFSQDSSSNNDPQNVPTDSLLQLEIDYAYPYDQVKSTEELFFIDVIPLEKMEVFENMLVQGDIQLAQQKLGDDRRENYNRRMFNERDDDFDPHDPI